MIYVFFLQFQLLFIFFNAKTNVIVYAKSTFDCLRSHIFGRSVVLLHILLKQHLQQILELYRNFKIFMREQTESNSFGEATSFIDIKKDSNNKKKLISKDKNLHTTPQHTEKNMIKLTKEERAKIQKEKNRQAAQRSRDMHKEYVTNLQQEVRILRQKIQNSARYCHRCQEILNFSQIQPQNQQIDMRFQNEEDQQLSNEIRISNDPIPDHTQPDSFMRLLQPQEELPFMKMLLLVCMIVIGVMVITNYKDSNPRILVQQHLSQFSQQIQSEVRPLPAVEEYNQRQGGLVQLHRGLQNKKCLDSLMKVEGPLIRRSLRSIHQFSPSDEMSDIMLCSLRSPKIYQIKPDLAESPLVRLFVSGSDIKKMVEGSDSMLRLTNRNIQLNGIYKLTAEIKSVQQLQHHSCIL